ncbi:hypothetical protein ABIA39_003800 [Nocardia sp. GAS34]
MSPGGIPAAPPRPARPRPGLMGICRLPALALMVWVLVASGCAGGVSGSAAVQAPALMSNSAPAAAAGRPFVFRSRTELVLATAERVLARYPGVYVDAGFAQDNSHIYALDESGVLTAIRVADGIRLPWRVDCGCDRVFPLHDSEVGWWQEPGRLMQADLRDPDPAVRAAVSLPLPMPVVPGAAVSGPRLLAAGERILILDQLESPPGASWGVNHLSLVDIGTGSVRALGPVEGVNTALDRAVLRPDGQAVALSGRVRDGIACGTTRLLRIDLYRERLEAVELPASHSCSELADLRWDDAELTVTDTTWESRSPDRLATAVWSRSGTRWDRRGDDRTVRYGALTSEVALEIRRTGHDRPHGSHSGDLVLAAAGDSLVLAHDVLDLRLSHG